MSIYQKNSSLFIAQAAATVKSADEYLYASAVRTQFVRGVAIQAIPKSQRPKVAESMVLADKKLLSMNKDIAVLLMEALLFWAAVKHFKHMKHHPDFHVDAAYVTDMYLSAGKTRAAPAKYSKVMKAWTIIQSLKAAEIVAKEMRELIKSKELKERTAKIVFNSLIQYLPKKNIEQAYVKLAQIARKMRTGSKQARQKAKEKFKDMLTKINSLSERKCSNPPAFCESLKKFVMVKL